MCACAASEFQWLLRYKCDNIRLGKKPASIFFRLIYLFVFTQTEQSEKNRSAFNTTIMCMPWCTRFLSNHWICLRHFVAYIRLHRCCSHCTSEFLVDFTVSSVTQNRYLCCFFFVFSRKFSLCLFVSNCRVRKEKTAMTERLAGPQTQKKFTLFKE